MMFMRAASWPCETARIAHPAYFYESNGVDPARTLGPDERDAVDGQDCAFVTLSIDCKPSAAPQPLIPRTPCLAMRQEPRERPVHHRALRPPARAGRRVGDRRRSKRR